MKRIVTFILAITFIFAACCSFAGCKAFTKEIELTDENASDYLFTNITYGNVQITENKDGTYYISCVATITVQSKGDYLFEAAQCTLRTGWGKWIRTYSENKDNISAPQSSFSGGALRKESYWQGTIQLDKNGDGCMTVFLYQKAADTYLGEHPISLHATASFSKASGTVIEN